MAKVALVVQRHNLQTGMFIVFLLNFDYLSSFLFRSIHSYMLHEHTTQSGDQQEYKGHCAGIHWQTGVFLFVFGSHLFVNCYTLHVGRFLLSFQSLCYLL
jgi:hypothetical protein